MYSSSYRKALVKALSKMSIETAATLEAMLARVTEKKHGVITFSDDDLLWKDKIIIKLCLSQLKLEAKRPII